MSDYEALPADLPVPVDDGGADHLPGLAVPSLELPATTGETIQSCAYRDSLAELERLAAAVVGISAQSSADQAEFATRLTLVAAAGAIVKVFYPVFPPDQNAAEVLAWLAGRDEPGD
jgi:peroxiredoxin